ncbi:MAG: hypothetical protein ACREP7_16310 [Lysobacter sp.]
MNEMHATSPRLRAVAFDHFDGVGDARGKQRRSKKIAASGRVSERDFRSAALPIITGSV